MAESDGIQEIVNKAAIQVATAVMMVLRDADSGTQPATTASLREPQRQRNGTPALEKPSFHWNAQERYIELLNF